MSTVPKADLARVLAVYEWLRSANPHLPPANKVALDVLTLEANPHISVSTLTLTVYINLPDAPFPGAPRVTAPQSPGRGAAAPDAALARERERVAVLSVEVAELRRGLGSCRMRAALLRKALDEARAAEETLDELRAQVEELSRAPLSPLDWVLRADVLALLDGGGDE